MQNPEDICSNHEPNNDGSWYHHLNNAMGAHGLTAGAPSTAIGPIASHSSHQLKPQKTSPLYSPGQAFLFYQGDAPIRFWNGSRRLLSHVQPEDDPLESRHMPNAQSPNAQSSVPSSDKDPFVVCCRGVVPEDPRLLGWTLQGILRWWIRRRHNFLQEENTSPCFPQHATHRVYRKQKSTVKCQPPTGGIQFEENHHTLQWNVQRDLYMPRVSRRLSIAGSGDIQYCPCTNHIGQALKSHLDNQQSTLSPGNQRICIRQGVRNAMAKHVAQNSDAPYNDSTDDRNRGLGEYEKQDSTPSGGSKGTTFVYMEARVFFSRFRHALHPSFPINHPGWQPLLQSMQQTLPWFDLGKDSEATGCFQNSMQQNAPAARDEIQIVSTDFPLAFALIESGNKATTFGDKAFPRRCYEGEREISVELAFIPTLSEYRSVHLGRWAEQNRALDSVFPNLYCPWCIPNYFGAVSFQMEKLLSPPPYCGGGGGGGGGVVTFPRSMCFIPATMMQKLKRLEDVEEPLGLIFDVIYFFFSAMEVSYRKLMCLLYGHHQMKARMASPPDYKLAPRTESPELPNHIYDEWVTRLNILLKRLLVVWKAHSSAQPVFTLKKQVSEVYQSWIDET